MSAIAISGTTGARASACTTERARAQGDHQHGARSAQPAAHDGRRQRHRQRHDPVPRPHRLTGANAAASASASSTHRRPREGRLDRAPRPQRLVVPRRPDASSHGLPTGLSTTGMSPSGALTAGPEQRQPCRSTSAALRPSSRCTTRRSRRDRQHGAERARRPPPAELAAGLTVFEASRPTARARASAATSPLPRWRRSRSRSALTSGIGDCRRRTPTAGRDARSTTCNSLLDVLVGGCKVVGSASSRRSTRPSPTCAWWNHGPDAHPRHGQQGDGERRRTTWTPTRPT